MSIIKSAYSNQVSGVPEPWTPDTWFTSDESSEFYDSSWPLSPIPSGGGLEGAVAVVLNDKIHLIGGHDGSSVTSKHFRYDPATNAWVELAAMPAARMSGAAGAVGGKILYVVGTSGLDSSWQTGRYLYDPGTDTWDTLSAATPFMSESAFGVLDDVLYMFSGRNHNSEGWGSGYSYDPVETSLGSGFGLISMPASAVHDGYVYRFGGRTASSTGGTNACQRRTGSSAASNRADIPVSRRRACAAAVNDGIVLVGGSTTTTQSTASAQTFWYDPVLDSWDERSAGPTSRTRACAAVVDDIVYVFGGMDASGTRVNNLDAYVP